MTQAELAARLDVSDKTISKWETARGLPDISLIEPLASVLRAEVRSAAAIPRPVKTRKRKTPSPQLQLCKNSAF